MSVIRTAAMAIGLCLTVPALAAAQTDGCDSEYVVQPGDTLRSIAEDAYGDPNYQLIFSRNFQVLSDPNDLPVGETLIIPCIPEAPVTDPDAGAPVSAAAESEAPAEDPEPQAAPAPEEAKAPEPAAPEPAAPDPAPAPTAAETPAAPPPALTVKFLTADGFPPFADRGLRGDGMASELIRAAARAAGMSDASRVVFINDRDSHLKDLLAEGSFDIGFPWYRPACDHPDSLTDAEARLCDGFTFSEPLYETIYGFFVRRGEIAPSRARFEDFIGARLCRPADRSLTDLEAQGFTVENTEIVRPATLADCMDALADGQVDAVSGEVFAAESILAEHGLEDAVEELSDLSLIQSIHAVAPTVKPGADAAMAALNRGLVELKVSGQWFRIVRRHLPHR